MNYVEDETITYRSVGLAVIFYVFIIWECVLKYPLTYNMEKLTVHTIYY